MLQKIGDIFVLAATAGVLIGMELLLCRTKSKGPGLFLPASMLCLSLLASASAIRPGGFRAAGVMLLLTNVPTVLLLAVYWFKRGRKKEESDEDHGN